MNQESSPTVSIVLGAYNRRAFLNRTLESVRNNGMTFSYDIFVVDGGSTDGSQEYLLRQKDVITIIQHNRGSFRGKPIERRSWGYFMNLGFKCAQGKYILMISDDCLLIPGAVENGVELFEKLLSDGQKVGALAFYWRNWPEQKNYWIGRTFGNIVFVNHGLYLREALKAIDYCDEKSFYFYHADGDICLRLNQSGYQCVDSPKSFVEHYSHANLAVRKNNLELQAEDWLTYKNRWEYLGLPETNWIEQAFDDIHQTAKKNWRALHFYHDIQRKILSVYSRIKAKKKI